MHILDFSKDGSPTAIPKREIMQSKAILLSVAALLGPASAFVVAPPMARAMAPIDRSPRCEAPKAVIF